MPSARPSRSGTRHPARSLALRPREGRISTSRKATRALGASHRLPPRRPPSPSAFLRDVRRQSSRAERGPSPTIPFRNSASAQGTELLASAWIIYRSRGVSRNLLETRRSTMEYGLVGILLIILLAVLIVYFARRA